MKENLESPIALYLSMGLTLVFIIWLGSLSGGYPEGGEERMVALEIAPNADVYRTILARWLGDPPDVGGLRALVWSFWIDFGFIIGYVLLLMASLGNVHPNPPARAYTVPLLVGVMDVLENVFHLLLLGRVTGGEPLPETIPGGLLTLAAAASHVKWVLFVVVTAAVLTFYLRNFVNLSRGLRIAVGIVLLGLLAFSWVYIQALLP